MQKSSQCLRRALTSSRFCASSSRLPTILRSYSPRVGQITQPPRQQRSVLHTRYASSLTVPQTGQQQGKNQDEAPPPPSYMLTFTCKPCSHRSTHRITKQGYHHGTVLIQCPSCKNRHVISDHLKIFMDEASTLEDILQRTAGTDKDVSKLLKKGKLGQRQGQLIANEGEEDLEFWEDGTTTKHTPPSDEKSP